MKNNRLVRVFVSVALCMVFLAVPAGNAYAIPFNAAVGTNPRTSVGGLNRDNKTDPAVDSTLLQFTSGGQVLGFSSRAVYLAGLDHQLRVEFVGGLPVQPVAESAGVAQNGIAPLGRVGFSGAWKNIDITYSAVAGGIAESTYIVHPGGDPADIRLLYNTPVEIEQGGGLSFSFANGYLTESAPIAWQEINGQRVAVDVNFAKSGEATVGFAPGLYNSRYTLYIDPTYQWHTFYGSGSIDYATAVAVDSAGNVYVAGYSGDTWNGPSPDYAAPLNPYSGYTDTIIVKLNSAGAYQWHTFYEADCATGIAVDSANNVYVAAYSQYSWNGPASAAPLNVPLNAYAGQWDITIIKLNGAGSYQWHTFYGSGSIDYATAVAVDSDGNVYVAGYSRDTWNGPPSASIGPLNAHTTGTNYDIAIVKLSSAGVYQWHTFYGSTGDDEASAITVDFAGNIYVAGYSSDTWNGPASAAPLNIPLNAHTAGSNNDIAIIKLSSAGVYQWHTFYGSTGDDKANAITVDSAGNIYVAGYSFDTWNGPASAAPLNIPLNAHTAGSNNDIAIIKLSSAGVYQWHTFYGSWQSDQAYAIAVDSTGNVYVAGYSSDTWNGPASTAPLNPYAGAGSSNSDITIIKLNSVGAYEWHTFYGAPTTDDYAWAIALDSSNNVYVAGISLNGWGAPLNQHGPHDQWDMVVLKLLSTPTVTNVSGASSIMATTAILHGNLTDTVGAATKVAIFSGISEDNWTRSDNLSITTAGPFSLGVIGLKPETTYFYRCYAENTAGGSWATSSSSFTTQQALGLWRNYWAGPGKDWFWFSSGGP